ncbi:helix-turn-helix domain-containing protein [Deinococcus sp. YIM 134068]|uniref:helix-turn-helix domain-containing protein n=1 Tax=Deinococcus lichenicola TaxID=3118910 RepID=UPI002F95C513
MTRPSVPPGVPQGLTTGQVAQVIRMSERTVRTWAEQGTLPFDRIGGRRYMLAGKLARWLDERGWEGDWEAVL